MYYNRIDVLKEKTLIKTMIDVNLELIAKINHVYIKIVTICCKNLSALKKLRLFLQKEMVKELISGE